MRSTKLPAIIAALFFSFTLMADSDTAAQPETIGEPYSLIETSVNKVSPAWELLPKGLRPYDQFRVVFLTSKTRNATERHQWHYHNFVRGAARDASLPHWGKYRAYVCGSEPQVNRFTLQPTHLAINLGIKIIDDDPVHDSGGRNTTSPDSRHHLDTKGTLDPQDDDFPATYDESRPIIEAPYDTPVYWLGGELIFKHEEIESFGGRLTEENYGGTVKLLNSYGPHTLNTRTNQHENGRDENGNMKKTRNVWTGCISGNVGSLNTDLGSTQVSARDPESGTTNKRSSSSHYSFYAVSPVYEVGEYEKQLEVTGTTGPIVFNSNAEASYTVGAKIRPPRDITVTATVVNGSKAFETKDNVRLSTTAGTAYADASESVTVTIARNSWQTKQTIYVIPKPGGRTHSGLFFIEHEFEGGVTDVNWHRFGNEYFRVKGRVRTVKVPTPDIVLPGDIQSRMIDMAPNAESTFPVKLSGPPVGWSQTVYISPVDDLSREQARCQVGNQDWTCKWKGQKIVNSNGDPVYVWSFSEPPLTLWLGNNKACLANSASASCNAHVRDHKFSKPKSKPYIALTFTKNNWNINQMVTVKRTGNSFRSYTDRTGKLYVSYAHPWSLNSGFKNHSKTKEISVTLNTKRGQFSEFSEKIEFFGIEESGVPKQMSDEEMQALTSDPEVSIVAAGASVTEGGNPEFTVTATPAPSAALTVSVAVTQQGDFGVTTGSQSVTIPTTGTATLTVSTTDDSTEESDGSVTATLQLSSGYTISTTQGADTAVVKIMDNDSPVARFTGAASTSDESGGTRNINISVNPSPASDITLNYTVGGTAAAGSDFTISGSGSVTVSGGSSTASIPVAITDDNEDEGAETVVLTLTSGTGYVLGNMVTHTLTITDNDDPPPNTPVVSVAGGEGITEGGTATFTLSAAPVPAGDITVNISVSERGSFAVSGDTGARQVTIGTGGSATLEVRTEDDSTDEPHGSVTVTVNTGSGYSPHDTAGVSTVAVRDNDDPAEQDDSATQGDNEVDGGSDDEQEEEQEQSPDRAALEKIYNATGGDSWENSENWNSGEPVGDWHGVYVVTVDGEERVEGLYLQDNGLSGDFPVSELAAMTELRELALWSNEGLAGAPDDERTDRAALRVFYDGNGNSAINGWFPEGETDYFSYSDWEGVTVTDKRVTELDLSDNPDVEGELPPGIMSLSALTHLDISGTKLCVPEENAEFVMWIEREELSFIPDNDGYICEEDEAPAEGTQGGGGGCAVASGAEERGVFQLVLAVFALAAAGAGRLRRR